MSSAASAVVGMIGGGQLSRMTHQAAIALGIDLHVLADDPEAPAAAAGATPHLGGHEDLDAVLAFARQCDVVTLDHELTPAPILRALVDQGHVVRPHPDAARFAQDKGVARVAFAEAGLPVPAFILVDRMTNATAAAGMIVDRSAQGVWDEPAADTLVRTRSDVELDERQRRYGQTAVTVLLTGLPASGKSTIARALERRLFDRGRSTLRLDGQNMRMGLSRDLGFSSEERSENLRRAAEVARLANNQGLIVLAAFVAPAAEVRDRVRELILPERFVEVFLDCPVDVARARDTDGMYARADSGEIHAFPGVTAPYDRPVDPALHLRTDELEVDACVEAIIELLDGRGVLRAPANGS